MTEGRLISPVKNNKDKQRTYADNIGRYNRAMKHGFYYEAILIDYALIEDRLRSFIYHIGGLKTKNDHKICKGHVKTKLTEIIASQEKTDKRITLGITNLSGKIRVLRATLNWAATINSSPEDRYLKALKDQYEGQWDIGGLLDTLDEIEMWCKYRNELIHALMNKNLDSVDEQVANKAADGMVLVRYLDEQVKCLKKHNILRRFA